MARRVTKPDYVRSHMAQSKALCAMLSNQRGWSRTIAPGSGHVRDAIRNGRESNPKERPEAEPGARCYSSDPLACADSAACP
jgi:hypothetical protein